MIERCAERKNGVQEVYYPGRYRTGMMQPRARFKCVKGKVEGVLEEFGVDPDDYYYTHAVKCRTPDKKQASAKQQKACKPYLEAEIEKVKPDYILLLGAVALKSLFEDDSLGIKKTGVLGKGMREYQ